MANPTEAAITTLREFTGLTSREALIDFLRGNSNNVEQAANAFFENPDPSRFKSQFRYDESQFSSDRQGDTQGSHHAPAFQLNDEGAVPQNFGSLTAPSRPPSRQQYGPHPYDAQQPPEYGSTKAGFDETSREEFEGENEAIKRSLAEQQTGIINSSGQEVVPDVEPNDRQRNEGDPVYIKHMLVQDFLPALLTVLHSVPKLRNALSRSDSTLNDYGFNSHWWSGESIEKSTVSYMDDAMVTEDTDSCPPLVAEVQRLMAFLTKTERSYGSAEALSRVHSIKVYEQTSSTPKALIERFVETWDSIFENQSLFLSTITDAKQSSEATRDIHMFEVEAVSSSDTLTLTDLLDNIFWDKKENGDFDADHFLNSAAPVQILTIRPHRKWRLDVPASLFLDRWLLSNSAAIAEMKDSNSRYVQEVDKINTSLKKLQTFSYNTSPGIGQGVEKEGNAIKLIEDSVKYLEDSLQGMENDPVKQADTKLTIAKLSKISERVHEKVELLETRKTKMLEQMKQLSNILTGQTENEDLEHEYVLCGVATMTLRRLTTYVQYSSSPSGRRDLDWWKMSYDTSGTTPRIEKSIVTEGEVLADAGKGLDETMLMFTASDMLKGPPPIPLPPQLERFVEKDNAAFCDELARVASGGGPGPVVDLTKGTTPITITGMRTRSESRGSNDSMMVNQDDEAIVMNDDDPPPYGRSSDELEDVKMDTQPEMKQVSGQDRPGLFGMPREARPGSDTEMEFE